MSENWTVETGKLGVRFLCRENPEPNRSRRIAEIYDLSTEPILIAAPDLAARLQAAEEKLARQPADWIEDPSLETWFPFAAIELKRLTSFESAAKESVKILRSGHDVLRASLAQVTRERDEARAAKRPFSSELTESVINGQVNRIKELEGNLAGWFSERDELRASLEQSTKERDLLTEMLQERIDALPDDAPVLKLAEMCRELAEALTSLTQAVADLDFSFERAQMPDLQHALSMALMKAPPALRRAESITGRKQVRLFEGVPFELTEDDGDGMISATSLGDNGNCVSVGTMHRMRRQEWEAAQIQ